MSIQPVIRGQLVLQEMSHREGLKKLEDYLRKRDKEAVTKEEQQALRASFADYEKAANNMGQPELAKAFAVGGQMVAVYGAMSTAAAAGMTIGTVIPAVGAAIVLISMFAAMDSGGDDALEQLQVQMRDNFVQVYAKLGEMEAVIVRNHKETLHEFTKVRYDINAAREGFSALLRLTQDEVRETRGDLHVQVERVADRIDAVAKALSYSLDELRLDKLRDTVDAIKHYELRGGMSVEKLKRKVAYLERWLVQPPGNKMLTGEYYAGRPDQGKYIEKSSLTGRIGLLNKIFRKGEDFSFLVDLDTFNDVLPTYVKAVKLLRKAGEDYDAFGKMWEDKVVEPLENCSGYALSLYLNYRKYTEAAYGDMQTSYDKAVQAAKDLLGARSQQLADDLERELREESGRIFLDMASVPHEFTRDVPYNGGWFTGGPGYIHRDLKVQKELAREYSALNITPSDLFDMRATAVNLKGRFARLLPARGDVYLYPTYLPLEMLPITTAIEAGLEAEKLGLGRLHVEARLVGRFERNNEYWLHAPGHPKGIPGYAGTGDSSSPKDPFWIALQWSFIDKNGEEFPLQDDRFSLNFPASGSEQYARTWIKCGGADDMSFPWPPRSGYLEYSWTWNGDALSASIFQRWIHSRVDLNGDDIEEAFRSCETEVAEVRITDRSDFIRFPAKRVTKWPAVNTMRHERAMELRRELFDPTKGDPFKKEVLRSSLEEMRESHMVIHALKEHIFGPQPCTALTIMQQDQVSHSVLVQPLAPLELAVLPNVGVYMQKHATVLAKAELLRAKILAVPVAPPKTTPEAVAYDPRVDKLEREVEEMKAMLGQRNAENSELMAQLAAFMAMMERGQRK